MRIQQLFDVDLLNSKVYIHEIKYSLRLLTCLLVDGINIVIAHVFEYILLVIYRIKVQIVGEWVECLLSHFIRCGWPVRFAFACRFGDDFCFFRFGIINPI